MVTPLLVIGSVLSKHHTVLKAVLLGVAVPVLVVEFFVVRQMWRVRHGPVGKSPDRTA